MNQRLVAHLSLAVLAAWSAAPAAAQDGDPSDFRAPRPRARTVVVPNAPMAPRLRAALPGARQDDAPKLGVMVADEDDGVLVSEVFEGSLAESAGVQPDDVLYKIAGQRVSEIADIPRILAESTQPGGEVSITVIRPGEGLVSLTATRPEPEPAPMPEGHTWTRQGQADGHRGAFLGVQLGQSEDGRVDVSGVIDGTAAWFAGLEKGDQLIAIDGKPVESGEAVAAAVAAHAPGDLVALSWNRDGESMDTRVRLGQRAPANPLGMLMGPGNAMPFGEMPFGNAPGQGRLRFFPGQGGGQVIELDDLDDWSEHMGEWAEHMGEWAEQWQGHEPGGHHEVKIRIDDGTMTIERDGKVEVHELGEHHDADHEHDADDESDDDAN